VGKFKYVVPAHGGISRPPETVNVINENINAINRLRYFVLNNINDSMMLEELIMKIFSSLGISIDSPHNYLLNRSALLLYVTWLSDDGLFLEIRLMRIPVP